jgi:hypothetical protein
MREERADMNVRYFASGGSEDAHAVPLAGSRGELLTVSIAVEPRDLEDLLDCLGQSQYPIDPQIYHDAQVNGHGTTVVEFAAYGGWMEEIERLLNGREAVTIRKCLTHAAPN